MRLETFAYVDNVDEAVAFYQKAFDAKIKTDGTWKNDDGTYEICAFGVSAKRNFFCLGKST